ncbi:hypothetical protein [Micromonospora zhanjiangensis]|uniref:Secreted protein n=1 Tax=Micromonospora zhanjiangensis TaxID=1522057 RepID=A0ABV8KUN3_9ACTN
MNFTAITKDVFARKTVLAFAGLAFAGGAIGAPVALATAVDHQQPTRPPAASESVLPVGKPAKPSADKLMPNGTPQAAQSRIDLSSEQRANAKAIVNATKKNGMDERAAVISIATSMQESKLKNLGHLGAANDHDSLGLFQQRPSSGWGSPEQITDPQYSTTAFLKGLKQVDGWQRMPLTAAAQKVQVSAYPDAYAQWESQAADLVGQYWNS